MIRNIQLNHGGKYVCVIDTDVESLSTSAILVVKGKPRLIPTACFVCQFGSDLVCLLRGRSPSKVKDI